MVSEVSDDIPECLSLGVHHSGLRRVLPGPRREGHVGIILSKASVATTASLFLLDLNSAVFVGLADDALLKIRFDIFSQIRRNIYFEVFFFRRGGGQTGQYRSYRSQPNGLKALGEVFVLQA